MSGIITAHNPKPTLIDVNTNPLVVDTYYVCTAAWNTAQTLPAATGSGKTTVLENTGTGVATLSRAGSDTINGATSVSVVRYDRVTVRDAGAGVWLLQMALTNAAQTIEGDKIFLDAVGIEITPDVSLHVGGNMSAGESAILNTSTALNGTGGGNRQFETSFTNATATGFTGTDSTDYGYGYFPANITAGKWYRVSSTFTISNGVVNYTTSNGLNFATQQVDSIALEVNSNQEYYFKASANATYVGVCAQRSAGTVSLTLTNMNIREVGGVITTINGKVGIGTTAPTAKLEVAGMILTKDLNIAPGDTTTALMINALGGAVVYLRGTSASQGFLHIRPNAGSDGYITFTEDAVLDRWAIGISGGASPLYFRPGTASAAAVANINASSGAYTATSDVRLKKDILPLRYGISDVMQLNPISYRMKSDETQEINLGFIAQEVEPILPEVISKIDADIKGIMYSSIIPVLTKAIQEQQVIIEKLISRIELLESK